MTPTCAHPHCRTSLDEHPVTCPHALPFCEHCTWEDGCDQCATVAAIQHCATTGHAPFWASDPRPHEDMCACGGIVRTVNTDESWAEHWAEMRKDASSW